METPIYHQLSTTYGIEVKEPPRTGDIILHIVHRTLQIMQVIIIIAFMITTHKVITWIKTGEGLWD